jgi:hypothetical protein
MCWSGQDKNARVKALSSEQLDLTAKSFTRIGKLVAFCGKSASVTAGVLAHKDDMIKQGRLVQHGAEPCRRAPLFNQPIPSAYMQLGCMPGAMRTLRTAAH